MNHVEFIEKVGARAGVSQDQAGVFARAVLQTLAERLTGGEARDLAAQLPKALQDPLRKHGESAEAFGAEEFVRRVSERSGLDAARAREVVRAVQATTSEAVTGGEFEDVLSQLPKEFREFVGVPQGRR